MRAVVDVHHGPIEMPTPEPGSGEVLIRVAYAGVNRADVLQAQGHYPPPPGASEVLGLECCGTIAALGADVTGFEIGDEVCALLSGGGYAEYVAVPAGQVAALPSGMDASTAAGLVETAATVWSNVFDIARLQPGEVLLVHGGSSGIGTTAIQLAKSQHAFVVTTVGSAAKAEACSQLGADVVINYREQDFVSVMKDNGISANVVLDIIGAKYLERNISSLAPDGRLIVIGLQGGVKAELSLATLLAKRASITATSLRSRSSEDKARIMAGTVDFVWPLIAQGQFTPVIDRVLDLNDAAQAHQLLTESAHIGKIVLRVSDISATA